MLTYFVAIPLPMYYHVPISYYSKWTYWYLKNSLVDLRNVVLADFANSMLFLCSAAFLVNNKLFLIAASIAHKFRASLAFVNSIELQHVKFQLAQLTLLRLVAFIDTLVDKFFQEHIKLNGSIKLYPTQSSRTSTKYRQFMTNMARMTLLSILWTINKLVIKAK